VREAIATSLRVARRERALVVAGLLGAVLAGVVGIVIAARGSLVPPEGLLEKPLTFDLAVGVYVLTLAVLAPLAGFSRRGGIAWRTGVVVTTLYGYGAETILTLRGIDPRFSEVAGPREQVFSALLGVDAVFIVLLFVIFAVRLFRKRVLIEQPPLALGARYGAVAVIVGGFSAGVWMGIVGGRDWGESASLLPLHAMGFHGLQAIPLVVWLVSWSGAPLHSVRRWIHAAGLLWLAALVAIALQTWNGRAIADGGSVMIAAAGLFMAWFGVAWAALVAALRRARKRAESASAVAAPEAVASL
jgi:hypothetical protein